MHFVLADVEVGHPDFGRSIPCPKCGPAVRLAALRRMSRLSPEMQELGWADVTETPFNRDIIKTLRRQVAGPSWFLTLLGPNGRGKTHMLTVMLNEAIRAGHSGLYLTTADFLDDLRDTFHPKAEAAYSKVFDTAMKVQVLVLDEFDRYNATPWAEEKVFQLVEHRWRNGRELLTCFASNAEIAEVHPYIRSRMQDHASALFNVQGPDMRPL